MNARELHDKLEYEHKAGLRWLFSSDAQERETVLRALRLLDAAEANDGSTPETDAAFEDAFPSTNETCQRLERERRGLAARVAELEPDAERYRFLCAQNTDQFDMLMVDAMHNENGLDGAIDAARRTK